MKVFEYEVRFTTPAFLGNAEQSGQWRTPPIKALLRQWWRVVYAADKNFSVEVDEMRREEGLLFGNAWLSHRENGRDVPDHCKSLVRLRLDRWGEGELDSARWPSDFGRVTTTRNGRSVPADLYLGYGPIEPGRSPRLTRRAVAPDANARLRLMLPDTQELLNTVTLIHWFGALGSRSRNGWGSLQLKPLGETPKIPALNPSHLLLTSIVREWAACHSLDWPHAIGMDAKGALIWSTDEFSSWRKAVGALARVRVAVRQKAKTLRNERGAAAALHYLGYPAGTGTQNPWALDVRGERDKLRLASPLRFKVVPSESAGSVRGLVFHLPCAIPQDFLSQLRNDSDRDWLADRENWKAAWTKIHEVLDDDPKLRRLPT